MMRTGELWRSRDKGASVGEANLGSGSVSPKPGATKLGPLETDLTCLCAYKIVVAAVAWDHGEESG